MVYGQSNGNIQTNFNNEQQNNTFNHNINLGGNMNINHNTQFLSKVSLILSLLSLVCCCANWLFAIPATIFAILALIKDKRDVTAWASLIIMIIGFGVAILVGMTGMLEEATSIIQDNTKQGRESVEQSIYNNNNIQIYYKGVVYDYDNELKFHIENNSIYNIKVKCDKLAINDYKMNDYMDIDVDAGLKGNDTIRLSDSTLEDNDIKNINKISGTFSIINRDTNEIIETFEFTIE